MPSEIPRPEDASEEGGMRDFLAPLGKVACIGPERRLARRTSPCGTVVETYVCPNGSTRYVATIDGVACGVLQIVSRDRRKGLVANVYVVPERRRQGMASMLLAMARTDFATVVHSTSLSPAGAAFAKAVG
jgi:GNAT superfamily N-acetyltransferase